MADDTKECPFCAETIKGKAIVCRYCGRELPPVVEENQDEEINIPQIEPIVEQPVLVDESKENESKPASAFYPPRKKQEQKNQVLLIIGLIVLIGCTLLGLYVFFIQPRVNNVYATINAPVSQNNGGSLSQSNSHNIGDTVNLYYGGIEILCGTSAQNYSDLIDTIINKDDYGFKELMAEGKTFTVPSGTKALVLDVDLTMAKVRILEGIYKGELAWVGREDIGK